MKNNTATKRDPFPMTHFGHSHSNSTDIRWLLFDFGGVLAEEGFHNALAELSERCGRPREELPRLAMDAVYDSGYVTGSGSEAEFWALLRRRFPFNEPDETVSAEILRRFTLRRPVLALVDALRRRGYLTGILSDQTDWLDQLDRRDRFFAHFDRIFNSYTMGKGKRDPALFDEVIAMLSIEPAQAIFIDDNPENVRRASSRGLRGIRYEDTPGLIRTLALWLGITDGQLAGECGIILPRHME